MPPTLRKRAAPPPAPPPAKKVASSKAKAGAKVEKKSKAADNVASKETKPPASNPAKDPAAGIAKGAGGVSATAAINSVADASATAAKVEADAVKSKGKKAAGATAKAGPVKVGDTIALTGFGGEVETHEGTKTTLAKLVEDSSAGVVLFTYPKASTPGCTTQACMFRDAYEPLTATGLRIYGLSTDSPKANTTFKTNKNLNYPLLCDPQASLIAAIGLKKTPSGTKRGVFVVNKEGKVLAAEPGSPSETVEVVKKLVASMGGDATASGIQKAEETAKSG